MFLKTSRLPRQINFLNVVVAESALRPEGKTGTSSVPPQWRAWAMRILLLILFKVTNEQFRLALDINKVSQV